MGMGEISCLLFLGGREVQLGLVSPATAAGASDPKGWPLGMLAVTGLGTVVGVYGMNKDYCYRRT